MGSAAFLVAAARYLGDRLVDAWVREGDPRVADYAAASAEPGPDAGNDPVVLEARRQVIEHCLYGVDINPMAVEMAKLSLWLVSMDPQRPFTFLDDRLVTGDSLLGITSLKQIEFMHIDPTKGRELHERLLVDLVSGMRQLVAEVAEERRELADIDGSTVEGLVRKRAVLTHAELKVSRARLLADLCVGAALAHAGHGDRGLRDGSIGAADCARRLDSAETEARQQARRWLDTDLPDGGFPREPLHWPLIFAEVFENGGFDAVIGNPPFLGGKKIGGASGSLYRKYLIDGVAGGAKGGTGNVDLVAYFLLRTNQLLGPAGQTGIIATNTLAQGDTREVGLDRIVAAGATIRRAIKSKPWPSKSAALEYCVVWASRARLNPAVPRILDGSLTNGISTELSSASRTSGRPCQLGANKGLAYVGVKLIGAGFAVTPELARELLRKDQRNESVLFPYLNGKDVNSRPDCSASRWVINFHDWSREVASGFPEPFSIVEKCVKPQRDRLLSHKKRLREEWWTYEYRAELFYKSIQGLNRVIVLAQVSRTAMPALVVSKQVFDQKIIAFASDDHALFALLSSAPHYWWALARSSTMKGDLSYSPTDVLLTLPMPSMSPNMRELGERLDTFRRDIMLRRRSGLTETYNLVFNPSCTDTDIVELRAIHAAIDEATVRAYGWDDMLDELDHGFHPAGREARYTIGPAAQREILNRLLELNHQRYAEEVAAGLHGKGKKRGTAPARKTDDQGMLL